MEASETQSNLLYINRLKVSGNWNRDIKIKNGINAIFADNERGKSIIVKIIFKTLCIFDDLDVESLQNIEIVYLEFKLNMKLYTIRYNYKKRKIRYIEDWKIDLFNSTPSRKISQSKLTNLIERELKLINPIKVNGLTQNSIRQCYRGIYLVQGLIKEVLSKTPGTRKIIFRSLLRLPEQSNNFKDLKNEIRRKKHRFDKQKKEKARLLDSKLIQIAEELRKEGIKTSNVEINKEKALLKEKYQIDINISLEKKRKEQNEINNKFMDLIQLHKIFNDPEVLSWEADMKATNLEKNDKSKEVGALIEKSKEKNTMLNKITRRFVDINRRIEEKTYDIPLVELDFKECPRCKRSIDVEMKKREKNKDPTCLMCNRDLKLTESKALSEFLKQRDETRNEKVKLEEEFKNIQGEITKINKELSEFDKKVDNLTLKKKERERKLSIEHTKKLEKFKPSMRKIELEIERYERISKTFDDSVKLMNDLSIIKEKTISLKQEEIKKEEYEKLEEKCTTFWEECLNQFLIKIFGSEIKSLDYFDFECQYFANKSKTPNDNLRNMITLGYYYAFLKTSLHFSIKFPRIVFLDCITTEELKDEKAQQIFKIFVDLKNEHKDHEFQLLIFTANPEVLKYPEDIHLIQPESGEYLFNVEV